LLGVGCSAASADDDAAGVGAGAGAAGGATSGTGGEGPILVGGSAGGSSGPIARDDCGGDIYSGESGPLDMFIMLDRSGSMIGIPLPFPIPGLPLNLGQDVWTPITSSLVSFVNSPAAAGISAGVQFFPLPKDAVDEGATCDVGLYSQAAAPIAPLPGNAGAIQAAIAGAAPPSGGTPTVPAMEGAMAHAIDHAGRTPGHKVIVVLATDGEPNDCASSIPGVAQIAVRGLAGSPRIETYVIGIGNVAGLNEIAVAGGSGQAIVISADPAVASQQFLDAMIAIRGQAIPCDFSVPPAGLDTPELVNIEVTDGGGATRLVPFVSSGDRCDPGGGGWYYDDSTGTRRILACPVTCQQIGGNLQAKVRVVVGCPQLVQ